MNKTITNWLLFVLLSITWGSSFILMKIGLINHLNPYHIASLRILSSGIALLPVALRVINRFAANELLLIFLSGALGNLIPAYLFCIAEQRIDSALAAMINSLTPIFVIVTGALLFGIKTDANKTIGIIIAYAGSVLLLFSKNNVKESHDIVYGLFAVAATISYGCNVNMVSKKLLHIPSLHIAAVALFLNSIPAILVLLITGYFNLPLLHHDYLLGTLASCCLGVFGTAIANIWFYNLVKSAGGIFASMVSYGIPFIAIGWGIYYNESVGWTQVVCLLIILSGVYYANIKKNKAAQ